jgi:hypothetical protein
MKPVEDVPKPATITVRKEDSREVVVLAEDFLKVGRFREALEHEDRLVCDDVDVDVEPGLAICGP